MRGWDTDSYLVGSHKAKCTDCGIEFREGSLFPVMTITPADTLYRVKPGEICPACMRRRLGL